MKFQTKLLLTYSILIILLVVILGVSFYQYDSGVFTSNAYTNLEVISEKMSQQLENLVHPMDFITTYLISDGSFFSAVESFATLDKSNPQNIVYINEGIETIRSSLFTYSIDKNFYRVSFFNGNGDFITSNFKTKNVNDNLKQIIDSFSWRSQVDKARGKAVILSPYKDPWMISEKTEVFGLVRSVQGGDGGIGYIEVQNRYSELEKIFALPNGSDTKIIAVTAANEMFYNNGISDQALLNYYLKLAVNVQKEASVVKNPIIGKDEIVVGAGSDYTGIKIILAQDRDALLQPLLFSGYITFVIGVLIIFLSLGYIYIFSRHLAKPIRQLKEKMESTELENLPEQIKLENSNNEIETLNKSFQRLRERLNDAVRREIKSHSLQMQASFDSLQAQVNPHFIYNILNVLSNRGIINGDFEICEICESIAAMLRYSNSTLKRSATIEEEIGHVRNYMQLMKKRFEHKLEFNIDIEQAIYNETIPKIVLQQIVENSINHGFESLQTIMKIDIRGYVSGEWWYVEITDNGQGFNPEVLCELDKKMKQMDRDLSAAELQTGLAIGGMGLINTYGRLALFHKGKFVFALKNTGSGGAQVVIGGILKSAERSSENVQDCVD